MQVLPRYRRSRTIKRLPETAALSRGLVSSGCQTRPAPTRVSRKASLDRPSLRLAAREAPTERSCPASHSRSKRKGRRRGIACRRASGPDAPDEGVVLDPLEVGELELVARMMRSRPGWK